MKGRAPKPSSQVKSFIHKHVKHTISKEVITMKMKNVQKWRDKVELLDD
jgi:hypothetical protein